MTPEIDPGALDRLAAASSRPAVRALLASFVERLEGRCGRIERALADADLAAAGREAHSMKGTARQFGALRIGELAARCEAAASGGDAATLRATLAELVDARRRFAAWASGWE